MSTLPPAWTKFQVGQRVWLKRPSPGWQKRKHKIDALPQLGQIYTIRETLLNCEGHLFIRLVEVVNKPRKWGRDGFNELAFAAWWFEPVKEQNIEVFRQICLTIPARQNQLESVQ